MSFIEQFRTEGPLAWLRGRDRQTAPAMAEPAPLPSFASVEYELSQLRLSLRGYVDFGTSPIETAAPLVTLDTLSGSGLKGPHGLEARLQRASQSTRLDFNAGTPL